MATPPKHKTPETATRGDDGRFGPGAGDDDQESVRTSELDGSDDDDDQVDDDQVDDDQVDDDRAAKADAVDRELESQLAGDEAPPPSASARRAAAMAFVEQGKQKQLAELRLLTRRGRTPPPAEVDDTDTDAGADDDARPARQMNTALAFVEQAQEDKVDELRVITLGRARDTTRAARASRGARRRRQGRGSADRTVDMGRLEEIRQKEVRRTVAPRDAPTPVLLRKTSKKKLAEMEKAAKNDPVAALGLKNALRVNAELARVEG
jgi:hypothetical protein